MKILHTVTGMGVIRGGIATSVYELIKGLANEDVKADILCFVPDKNDKLIGEESFIKTITRPKNNKFFYSKSYEKYLINELAYDLYHINGFWQYPTYITAKIASQKRKPYVVSPHGMLYPQELKKSKWLKKVIWWSLMKKSLENATCIHATCHEEMEHLRALGIKNLIAVIPNPININYKNELKKIKSEKVRIGYMGRIHPRKNLEALLLAWSNLQDKYKDIELVIIGGGEDNYVNSLKEMASKNNLMNIVFTGFLFGEEKRQMLSSLSFLVVPSHFENFGMIIPEALLENVPVIASKGTPWQELEINNCGWWVNNDVETLTSTIEKAINLSEPHRDLMGSNGRQLVLETYSTQIVSLKIKVLYNWIINGGEKPSFVYN